ncbi:hypothetical protein [Bradyrhizobium canariense]|uniref:hypothetical protein n=1 Tax=Bradyrhizobium canariense TaxID=255045 RepID=UPI001177E8A0|nr:hypothetical protein [Bradyrhizobium canariense]
MDKVIFEKREKFQLCYVVDLKDNSRITDTKKAGCADQLFSCVRRLEPNQTTPFVGFNSSGLFASMQ